MADGITAEIFGNIAVLKNLDKVSEEIQARAQEKLEEAGHMAKQYADDHAPVKSGYLRSRNQLTVRKGRVILSNDARYAIPVVMGHLTRGHQSFVPPNDFITPGWLDAGDWLKENLRGLV